MFKDTKVLLYRYLYGIQYFEHNLGYPSEYFEYKASLQAHCSLVQRQQQNRNKRLYDVDVPRCDIPLWN